jgi:hypothetical protein
VSVIIEVISVSTSNIINDRALLQFINELFDSWPDCISCVIEMLGNRIIGAMDILFLKISWLSRFL